MANLKSSMRNRFVFVVLLFSAIVIFPVGGQESTEGAIMEDAPLLDKIHGCLLGKCIGFVLGQTVEGWTKQQIEQEFQKADCYPVTDLFPPILRPSLLGGCRDVFF